VARFDRSDRTLLAAGENPIMEILRTALRSHPVRPALGASAGEIVQAVVSATSGSAMPEGVMALQVPPTFMGKSLITQAFVEHAHRHDVQVHAWTINDLEEIESLVALGVDGIVTDHPGRMRGWLDRRP
jgi:glycerophosphoryl diester phosphodiesterase